MSEPEAQIHHKAVKAPHDTGYASEWNDEHTALITQENIDLTHDPPTPKAGDIKYNATDKHPHIYVE